MSTSKRINRTDGEWEELIKEFNASGLTQGVFCEQRGVANRFNGDTDKVLDAIAAAISKEEQYP